MQGDEPLKIDDPIKVEIQEPVPDLSALVPNKPATTTAEDDRRTSGQREINLIWETTQRNIAYIIVIAAGSSNIFVVIVGAYLMIAGVIPSPVVFALGTAALMQLNTMAGLVLGFYFGRTNHARKGDALSAALDL